MRLPIDQTQLVDYCRALAMAVNCCDYLLCRVLGVKPMYAPAADTSITPHLAISGFWDAETTCFMLKHVEPGMRWADIGANVGYFSTLLSELTSDAPGWCYEPSSRPFTCLQKNLRVNSCSAAVAINAAVGREAGDGILTVADECSGGGSLLKTPYAYGTAHQQRCEIVTLDKSVDFLKVDAEGLDLDIVLSLKHKPRIVICEYAHRFPACASRAVELFDSWNVRRIGDQGEDFETSPYDLAVRDIVNLYLTPKS